MYDKDADVREAACRTAPRNTRHPPQSPNCMSPIFKDSFPIPRVFYAATWKGRKLDAYLWLNGQRPDATWPYEDRGALCFILRPTRVNMEVESP